MADEVITTPAGTEEDPYLATTWAELVAYSTSGGYVKVANNIDVLTEYPNGDAPSLTLGAYIDGDNKTISRWYCTGSRYLINSNTTDTYYIENSIFTNIKTGYHLVNIAVPYNMDDHILVKNCKFAGIMGDGSIFTPNNDNRDTRGGSVRDVAINIRGGNLKLYYFGAGNEYRHFYNFNVELTSSNDVLVTSYYSSRHIFFHDSQFVLHTPNLTRFTYSASYCSFDNCVVDVYNETNDIGFNTENSTVSIFNQTHAPATTGSPNKFVGVDNTHWLDAAYLANTVGFNIVAGD